LKKYHLSLNEKTFFFIALFLTILVRLRFIDSSLERDEGEYAYAGMMILRGQLPYSDFYNMKLPGVYYMYALAFKFLGQSIIVIRSFLLFLNLLTAFFVFKMSENWFSRQFAWWASGIFLLLSLGFHAQGWIANCEHFVNVFVAAGLVFLTKRWHWTQLFLCGLMFGTATLMKQHAFHFAFFPAILLLKQFFDERDFFKSFLLTAALGVGFVLPLVGMVAFFYEKGVFDALCFYLVDYAMAYSNLQAHFFDNLQNFPKIMVDNAVLWIAMLVVLYIIVKKSFNTVKNKHFVAENGVFLGVRHENTEGVNLCILVGLSIVSVCPGWYFRFHYFQYLFIPCALLMAYNLVHYDALFGNFAKKIKRTWFLTFSLVVTLAVQIEYFGLKSAEHVSASMYQWAYFGGMRDVGNYLKNHVKPNEYVGQLTREPQIWFYSQTQAASGFLYSYPLIENHIYAHKMVEQYIQETEKHHPNWFVYADIHEEDANPESEERLKSWAKGYLKDFELKAILYKKDNIKSSFETNFFAIDTSREVSLEVYQRKAN
jgi:Dolichyl-phosphate-mannose-protein mannosyltransferase